VQDSNLYIETEMIEILETIIAEIEKIVLDLEAEIEIEITAEITEVLQKC
jgi:hypothetical protein